MSTKTKEKGTSAPKEGAATEQNIIINGLVLSPEAIECLEHFQAEFISTGKTKVLIDHIREVNIQHKDFDDNLDRALDLLWKFYDIMGAMELKGGEA